MESRLDALFKTNLRQTESTDTWMGLRRKEQDEGRKKHPKKEAESDPDAWEDKTTVSIPALIAFLKSLLTNHKKKGGDLPEDRVTDEESGVKVSLTAQQKRSSAKPSTEQQQRSKAVSAYEKTAGGGQPPQSVGTDSVPQDIQLSAEQVRAIHTLLSDLEALDSGIETLEIQKGSGLLDSLQNAVDQIK